MKNQFNLIWKVVCGIYLLAIFPYAYFRHDDWLILGNAVHWLPQDWGFLFRPTLFFQDFEEIWFFRPFFKLAVFLFYQGFGFSYSLWLFVLFCCMVAAFHLFSGSVRKLSGDGSAYFVLVTLWTGVYFQFGSMAWMGEGMMNCPQLLLLALSFYWFVDGKQRLSLVAFVLSLGFKESGIVHAALICALVWEHPKFKSLSGKAKVQLCLPWVFVSIAFLAVRLLWMPINPAYRPNYEWASVLRPALIFLAAFTFPVLIARFIRLKFAFNIRFFGAILVLSLVPFFGHGFFSPGWLLIPLSYWTTFLGINLVEVVELRRAQTFGWVQLGVSVAVIVFWLTSGGWWQWHSVQKQVHAFVREADTHAVHKVVFINCPNPEFETATLHRVIGFEHSIEQLWRVHHDQAVAVQMRPCNQPLNFAEDALVLKWEFPTVAKISSP